jgi:soluble lytic murein transglycosylase-like protein
MDVMRRKTLMAAVSAALLPLAPALLGLPAALAQEPRAPAAAGAAPDPDPGALSGPAQDSLAAAHRELFGKGSPIRVIYSRSASFPLEGEAGKDYVLRLARATHAFVADNYAGRRLPEWGKPFEAVDLERRIANIAYWAVDGARRAVEVYPVDPAWVMGQIMAESFFYEFSVSPAFAVGVCQFIAPTARDYGMITAGDLPEHARPPYKKPELAGQVLLYYSTRDRWKQLVRSRKDNFPGEDEMLLVALRTLVAGGKMARAKDYLAALDREGELSRQVKDARAKFKDYIVSNLEGRDIFKQEDVDYLRRFDERATYSKPIRAMALMLARHLKARNGNILAAAAGYNAGLGATAEDSRVYGPYGRIPNFEETVAYVSRLFVNHHEILRRM